MRSRISWTAVGAHLALYHFTLKTKTPSPFDPRLTQPLPKQLTFSPIAPSKDWDTGVVYAEAQNLARTVRGTLHLLSRVRLMDVFSSWSFLRTL